MKRDEMLELIADATTKSDKIRLLYRAGVTKADIGRFLEIRYQHVYNVLLKEPAPVGAEGGVTVAETNFVQLEVDPQGRITLPSDYLTANDLSKGGTVVCRRDPEGVTIMSRAAALEYLRGIARKRMPEQADLLEALLGDGVLTWKPSGQKESP